MGGGGARPSPSCGRRVAPIALLRYAFDLPSETLCIRLLEERGVMFTPGSALDMEGYLRIGYANGPRVLADGLAETSAFLAALGSGGR